MNEVNLQPIGTVHSTKKEVSDDHWLKEDSYVELIDDYPLDALAGITDFSHVEVLFYMNQVDPQKIEISARHPRNNTKWPKVGIFAQRGKNRPNQIGLTVCDVLKVEDRKLFVRGLDALDGSPVLDIKPWMKEFGLRGAVRQPEWSSELMRNYWEASQTREAFSKDNRTPDQAINIARSLCLSRYPSAQVIFCAGSIMRGEGTETSDIDLVVVLPKVEFAWRESLVFDGWPVEAFVHDPETLHYYFREVDAKSGVPSLPQMVLEGKLVLGTTETAENFKRLANQIMQTGPTTLSEEDIKNRIYGISDLVEDLKAPRTRNELIGSAVRLYDVLADFSLRSSGHWSDDGKQIPRALKKYRPELSCRFAGAFDELFIFGNPAAVVSLAEELIAPFGGFTFDGYRRDAPETWRLPLEDAL